MNPHLKNLALWLVIGLIVVLVFNIFNQSQPMQRELIFSDFMGKVERNEVTEVTLKGSEIYGRLSDSTSFRSYAPEDSRHAPAALCASSKVARSGNGDLNGRRG